MAVSFCMAISSMRSPSIGSVKSTQPSEKRFLSWASSCVLSAPGESILLTKTNVGT